MISVSKGRRDRVNPWTYVFLVALLVPFLFPLGWMLLSSLKTQVENTAYPPIWLFTPTLANYREVFSKNPFFTFTVNSLVVAAGLDGPRPSPRAARGLRHREVQADGNRPRHPHRADGARASAI